MTTPSPSHVDLADLEARIERVLAQVEDPTYLELTGQLYHTNLLDVPVEVRQIYALYDLARTLSELLPWAGLEVCEQARTRSEALGCAPGLAWYWRERGSILQQLGLFDQATEHLERGLQAFQALGIQVGVASSVNILGHVLACQGELPRALEAFEVYVRIARELGRRHSEVIGLGNIAEVHLDMGEPWRALEVMLESKRAMQDIQIHPGAIGWLMANIGRAYADLGQPERAIAAYHDALQQLRGGDDLSEELNTWCKLAETQMAQADWAAAREALEQAQRINEQQGTPLERALIQVLRSRCERLSGHPPSPGPVLEALRTAQDARERLLEVAALIELAALQPEQVQTHLERALQAALEVGIKPHITQARLALVQVLRAEGQPEHLWRALDLLQAQRDMETQVSREEAEHRVRNLSVQFAINEAERETALERRRREEIETTNQALETANQENTRLLAQLRAQAEQLERMAALDALTNVANRRTLEHELNRELERARRYAHPLSVVFCDIDHFKRVNDRFSHGVGDLVLQQIARLLSKHSRVTDLVARYGGEEFVLVMPETSLSGAVQACEHLRAEVQAFDWSSIRPGLEITMSFGVNANTACVDANAMLDGADSQLYAAKQQGRNRVSWLGAALPTEPTVH